MSSTLAGVTDYETQSHQSYLVWWTFKTVRRVLTLYLVGGVVIAVLALSSGASDGEAVAWGIGAGPWLALLSLWFTSSPRRLTQVPELYPPNEEDE